MSKKIQGLFDKYVIVTANCWLWTGALKEKGYGQCNFNGKNTRVHRLFYQYFRGPIPDGLVLDHLCRVRNCVNPAHLEPVTCKVNSERGFWAMKTRCPKGHEYTTENTLTSKGVRGGRICRACKIERNKKDWPKRAEQRRQRIAARKATASKAQE